MYAEPTSVAEMRERYAAIRKKFKAARIIHQGPIPEYAPIVEPQPVLKGWRSMEAAILSAREYDPNGFQASVVRSAVLEVMRVPLIQFQSPRRQRNLVIARQLFYYMARNHTKLSFPQIAVLAGGIDHTTVMYGVAKIEADTPKYRPQLDAIFKVMEEKRDQ